jgi:hypothetical protein
VLHPGFQDSLQVAPMLSRGQDLALEMVALHRVGGDLETGSQRLKQATLGVDLSSVIQVCTLRIHVGMVARS